MKRDKPGSAGALGSHESSSPHQPNAQRSLRDRSSVLLAVLGPFFLDIWVGGVLLTSVLGAALWGLLILVAVLAPRTRDPKLKKIWTQTQISLWVLWLLAWVVSAAVQFASFSPETTLLQPLSRIWLVRIHAFLLAGASGLVLLFGVSSLAQILQMKRLRSSSWARRSSSFQLPSIESLSRVSSSAVFWSFSAWGVGLSLATLTLIVSLEPQSSEGTLASMLSDPKILLTCLLWLLLGLAFLIQTRTRILSLNRAYWLASLSGAFWLFLTMQVWLDTSSFHEPLRWFLR
jgi:hypothetical protein